MRISDCSSDVCSSDLIVWMPTFSAANHIEQHRRDAHFDEKFPTPKEKLLQPTPLRALDDNGALRDELKFILDLIAEGDLVLSAGHLHISEIWPLFEEAKKRGVRRLLVRSEEHTSELPSLLRTSYAVFCLKKK